MYRSYEKYQLTYSISNVHKDTINSIRFSPHGQYLASCSHDGTVVVVDVEGGRTVKRYAAEGCPPYALTWGGSYSLGTICLYVGLLDGRVLQYRQPTPNRVVKFFSFLGSSQDTTVLAKLAGPIRALHFDYATERLIVAHGKDVCILMQTTSGNDWRIHCQFKDPPRDYIPAFGFKEALPVGVHIPLQNNHFVIAYRDLGIMCYRMTGASAYTCWTIPPERRIGLSAISPDGTLIAAWNLYNGVDIYSLSERAPIDTFLMLDQFPDDGNILIDLHFINDGEDIVVGSSNGKPQIIDALTGTVRQTLYHSQSELSRVAVVMVR